MSCTGIISVKGSTSQQLAAARVLFLSPKGSGMGEKLHFPHLAGFEKGQL